jgi:CRP/FNR family transcriptional regulator, cyclic AMP receptor protein
MAAPPELIQSVPLFSDLSSKEVEQISRSFKERVFAPGDHITEEGKGGVGFFVIEEGTAKITVGGEERGSYGPGDYFGEVALIDAGARSATIIAETELRCYGITSWEFRPLVESHAGIAWKMLETLARMLRAAQDRHD